VEEFGRACRADIDQLCGGVDPGAGRIIGCLNQHQLRASTPCQAILGRISDARERVASFRKACTADLESLCKGVPQRAAPLIECLQANESRLSPDCNAADLRLAVEAASLVDTVEEMTSSERVREALQILQGIDSVAFSRSQVLLQFDSFEGLHKQANGARMLFNPQFVFGPRSEYSLQLKAPVTAIYPYASGVPTQFGLGAIYTSFAWNFLSHGQIRQYLALAVQWQTASTPMVGAPWALVPSYAIAMGLARWVSLTVQTAWLRSLGSTPGYLQQNMLLLEPILVFALPGRSFLALDTKLAWDFVGGSFAPVMKGVAGIFTDRQKSLSITVWYQAALTTDAQEAFFKYGVGLGLAYYFDW
jgi:hypothetical protein